MFTRNIMRTNNMNYNFDSLTNRLNAIKEDKYFVGDKNYQGYEICMIGRW